jgi:spermidine synthase
MAPSWFTEKVTPYDSHRHALKKILVRKKTQFQNAVLAETYSFGRCLILDGELQSAQADEFVYHEALVHPAMVLHPAPRDILILGGGEGATVREILRHPSVRQVTMVDIDGEVVQFCKKYLTSWHRGAFSHRKTRLVIADAKKYINQTQGQFDIIVSDLPTPMNGGPLSDLYTPSFYKRMRKRLKPGGLFVAQAGAGNWLQSQFYAQLGRTLRKRFSVVRPYFTFVPSFDEPWAFLLASPHADPAKLSAARVNKRLGTIRKQLRFFDGQAHEGLFRIAKHLRTV